MKNSLIVSFFAILMLMGCAGDPTKLYKGPELPESSLSRIIIDCSKVNGCDYAIFKNYSHEENFSHEENIIDQSMRQPQFRRSKPLNVLPGRYSIHIWRNYDHISGMFIYQDGYKSFVKIEEPYNGKQCAVFFNITAGETFRVFVKETEHGMVTENDVNKAGEKGLIVIPIPSYSRNTYRFFTSEIFVVDQATSETVKKCTFGSSGIE